MTTLYDIGTELETLDTLLTETEGEITPEIAAWLEEFAGAEAAKLQSIARYWRNLEAEAAMLKEEADRLTARRRTADAKLGRLKQLVLQHLQRRALDRVEAGPFKFRRQANGGAAPVRLLVAPEALPAGWQRVTVAADTAALRAALEAGAPEALAVAELESRGESVRLS